MKIKLPAFLLCASMVVASASHAAPVRKIVPKGAVSLTAKPQKFAVWLPTKPQRDQRELKAKNGKKAKVFIFTAESKEISYLIVAVSSPGVPKSELGSLDVEEKSFLNSSGGTLLKRENLRLNGVEGREIQVKSPIGRTARVRIFITPNSRYVLMAQGEPADVKKQSAQINRFFDSFRILP